MKARGSVIIIPNEEKIQIGEYKKDIYLNHLEGFIDFSDKFNLGYKFSMGDYQYAPEALANDGHLIVKIEEESKLVIFYIPPYVTDRQFEWYEFHKYDYTNYNMIGAFSITNDIEATQLYGLQEINKEMFNKNRIYHQDDIKKL